MTLATLVWGSPAWIWPAGLLAVLTLGVLVWSYLRSPGSRIVRLAAAVLKSLGFALLLACLLEPLFSGTRPRPGANTFVVLADDSRSLQIHDPGASQPRADTVRRLFAADTAWQTRLSQQFDVRRYRFAERLQALESEGDAVLTAEGAASSLLSALDTIRRRFRERPLAGVLLLTDGNATDLPTDSRDWSGFPPIYPVVVGSEVPAADVALANVSVSQTNFEQAPVTLKADVSVSGDDEKVIVQLLDEAGELVEQATVAAAGPDQPSVARFQFRPDKPGTSFYQLRAAAESEQDVWDDPGRSSEATLANNIKLVTVQRPAGPYRVLYVSGRANWEFKFLRRALAEDTEVELVGLVRIAKREPKFSFLARDGERTNPLYRGFEDQDPDAAEQYDEPVLIRLGTQDASELRDGFPQTADLLYDYHAVILDDLEAGFFTQDQMLLLQKFVSVRGGGFLMLGGAESFFQGEYQRTPIGEMLPVYLDRQPPAPDDSAYQLQLTREGWLQPWVRLRPTEQEERTRLTGMPTFQIVNRVRGIKPGAAVLASVHDSDGDRHPALVTQRFGTGRASALLIGDVWAWALERPAGENEDAAQAWRQLVRWLVADVPGRIELDTRRQRSRPGTPTELVVHVRDPEYQPQDNASVELIVTTPDDQTHRLSAEPSDQQAGSYVATYLPRAAGAYRVQANVTAPDGSSVGQVESGWAAEPAADEFQHLTPNRALLQRIAQETGGRLVEADQLAQFAGNVPERETMIIEPWVYPLWHGPLVFLLAVTCLVGEWGLRRWKGLP